MSLLSVDDVGKSFGGPAVLDGLSFTVEAGEMVAIIGPNGAGKSTCFAIIGGQLAPDRGKVLFEGEDTRGLAPSVLARRGMGRTFQSAAVFTSMTVSENLRLALAAADGKVGLAPLARGSEDVLLAELGFEGRGHVRADGLPYGDLKKLELGMALAGRPRLLLMDEPTAGMGPDQRAGMMRLVSSLTAERGIGVLFTEHDIATVFGHAARVLVLAGGRLAAQGTPEEVSREEAALAAYLGQKKAVFPAGGAL